MHIGDIIKIKDKKTKVGLLWATGEVTTQSDLFGLREASMKTLLRKIKKNNYIQISDLSEPIIVGLGECKKLIMRYNMFFAEYI